MESFEENTHLERQWPWWRLIFLVFNLLALVVSVILTWHYAKGGSMPGCTGGNPCEQVLSTRWSTIGGILPVSSLAVGVYLAIFVSNLFIDPATEVQIRLLAWKVLLVLAGAISGTAIWFIIVQKWFIGEFCPYCMTLHITGLLLSTLIAWKASRVINVNYKQAMSPTSASNRSISRKPTVLILPGTALILVGLLMSGILAAGQAVLIPDATNQSGVSKDTINTIDYTTAPIIGSPDAPYIVKLLFDYQCPHCQKLHFMLSEAVKRYAGKLAFVLCPAPLNTQCNPYIPRDVDAFKNSCELARIGLSVWLVKKEAFTDFENWMFTYQSGDRWQPRSLAAVRTKATDWIGKEKINEVMNSEWVEKYLQSCIQVYGQTIHDGKGGIPKLVYGSRWVIPEANSTEELIELLQKSLGLPKP